MPLGGLIPYEEDGEGAAGLEPDEQQIIQMLEKVLQAEPDTAKSAELAAVIQKLYKLLADEENSQLKALGGNPDQLRQLGKVYGG